MADTKKLNLRQKLVEIQKTVRSLGKNTNAGYGASSYQYVSGSKVLDAIKPKMNDLGLLLNQEIISIENEREDYSTRNGAKSEILTTITMRFTWVDADSDETLSSLFAANGMNGFDKGLGSALTYGERYFLLKFFHIPTDEDDVDALPERDASPSSTKKATKKASAEVSQPSATTTQPMVKAPIEKRDLEVGSKTWMTLVERAANGEDLKKQMFSYFNVDQKLWEQFGEAVVAHRMKSVLLKEIENDKNNTKNK